MTTETLSSEYWQPFFDRISKTLAGRPVRVEVTSLAIGNQIEAESLALLGITYEPREDVIELSLDGLHHEIHSPVQVFIQREGTRVVSLEIVDGAGEKQIVSLVEPVLLAAVDQKAAV